MYNPSLPHFLFLHRQPVHASDTQTSINCRKKHILLGDFNLHHPLWNHSTRSTEHAESEQLLHLTDEHNLALTLPKGTVTWEARQTFSTIDLVFMSDELTERLEHCMSRPELNQLSDHVTISTRITLNSEAQTTRERRAWKLTDMEKLREAEKRAPPPRTPRSPAEIDAYTVSIQKFLQEVIEIAVPWARPSKYAKPFWNDECSVITKETRRLRRV